MAAVEFSGVEFSVETGTDTGKLAVRGTCASINESGAAAAGVVVAGAVDVAVAALPDDVAAGVVEAEGSLPLLVVYSPFVELF